VIGRWILVGLLGASLAAPQNESDQQALSRAVQLHQSGRYADAITDYQAYLKAHPQAAAVRSNLGAALAHEGRYTEAVREYTLALSAQPSNYEIRLNLALAYYKMGEIEPAAKEFEAVYSVLHANDLQGRKVSLLLAECYLRQNQNERVIALLSPLADADPDDLGVAYLLGTALLHEGLEERGALMIQRILRNGDTAEAHMLMAFTRMKANDNKGAMAELDRAIELNPNLPEEYNLRGRLDFIESDVQATETAFRKSLSLDPNSFDALFFLGTLLREQGRLEEAHSRLEHAMQLQPKEIRVRYQFALLCSAEGNDRRAAALLEALVKDAPEYTEAHRSLSTIYSRMGRVTEGRHERKVAEALDASIQSKDQERGRTLK
jgi:tetratricopeptide (TPR) repeat protein